MKKLIGFLMIVGGIFVGLYVGLYLMFIGGVTQIVDFFKQDLPAINLAWGILRILFASITGFLSSYILIIPGVACVAKSK